MRRKLFVLTVAALMAAMMLVSAGPAQANVGNVENSNSFVLFGNNLVGVGDIGDFDGIDFDNDGIGVGHNCCGNNFGHNGISFGGGIDQDSDSGGIKIG